MCMCAILSYNYSLYTFSSHFVLKLHLILSILPYFTVFSQYVHSQIQKFSVCVHILAFLGPTFALALLVPICKKCYIIAPCRWYSGPCALQCVCGDLRFHPQKTKTCLKIPCF